MRCTTMRFVLSLSLTYTCFQELCMCFQELCMYCDLALGQLHEL